MDVIEISDGALEVLGEIDLEILEVGYLAVGPGSGGGSGGSHVHTQSAPALTWTITHALGYLPAVAVIDTDKNLIDAAIAWPDGTTVIVTLAASTAGKALLS